ncbi:MAG: PAS domain S-box protein [Ginsengibacter sp.]
MNKRLKILHLEDVRSDAELIGRVLKKGNIDCERLVVDTKDNFIKALKDFSPDIILSDHSLPSFNSHEALIIFQEARIKIPFILITAAISEEFAVDVIKRGADDYLLKDRLERLPTAIHNSLEKFRMEREREIFLNELIKKEKYYCALVENGADAIVVLDKEVTPTYASASIQRVLGYSEKEAMQLNMHEILHPDDRNGAAHKTAECLQHPGIPIGSLSRIKHKDGRWVWLEATIINMFHDPVINGIVANFRDVTDRIQAQTEIKKSEEKYRAFFENSMDGILLTVTDGKILAANPAACEMFRMTEEEICKAGRFGLADNSDSRVMSLIHEHQTTGSAKGELTYMRKDGSKFPGEISSVVFKDSYGQECTSMIIRDISERKKTEEKILTTSNELHGALNGLNSIMDSSLDIICTIDEVGRFVSVSAASERILGYTPYELKGRKFIDLVFIEDVERTIKGAGEVMSGVSYTMFENRYVHKNGSVVPILWSVKWDDNDKLIYCIAKDATEKKRLEKAFEIERQRFYNLFQQAPTVMGVLKGPDYVYEMANPLCLKLIGKKDIIGKTLKEVMPEVEEQGFIKLLDNVYATGEPFSADEMPLKIDKEGNGKFTDVYLNLRYQPYRNGEEKIEGIFFFAVDVTEQVVSRKKIEVREQQLKIIYNTVADIIFVLSIEADSRFKFISVNQTFLKITGLRQEQIVGQYVNDVVPSPSLELVLTKYREALTNKKTVSWEEVSEYQSGKKTGCVSISPVIDENGNCTMLVGTVYDITERKKASEEMKSLTNRLLLATNSAGMGIWDWDIQKNNLIWDEGMYKLYNIKSEQFGLVYEGWISRLHEEDVERINEDIQMAVTGKRDYNTEFRIIWSDQSIHHIKATGMIERDDAGNTIRMIGLNWDITDRKLSEFHLKDLNKSLERQAKELTQSNAELEQFAYVASHDLQEPLRTVTSFLTQLDKKYNKLIDEKGKKYIHFAVDGAKRMRQIIQDLLEFSKVGRTGDSPEYLDLNKLINEIQILFQKQIEEKNAIILFSELPVINNYKVPLLQVFQNLIGNALKFTREDIPARICITSKESEDHWQFAVSDNGIGIEDEYFNQIFAIFQRLHSKDDFSGTGIGLAITKKIIENLGGKIWVESMEGEGSTFYFTISK